jgi:beta-lactamase class A
MTELSRRSVLVGGLTLAAMAANSGRLVSATPPSDAAAEAQIAGLEQANGVSIGLFAVDLASGRTLTNRAQESFAVCSTFKGYAAARVLQMVEHGELTLDRRVFVDPADVVANSPRTQPRAGGEMTLDELCQAALQVSDNTAGNLLLKTIGGPQAITAFARSIGDGRTRLDRWETELNSAVPGDPRDTSTPEAIGGGYRALLDGDALALAQRQHLQDWMRANETSSLRAGLPPQWTSFDKTGSGDYGSTNDIGIAAGPDGRRVLLAIMTRTTTGDPHASNNREVIGALTALVLPALLA